MRASYINTAHITPQPPQRMCKLGVLLKRQGCGRNHRPVKPSET
jgi:hypothetical protein